MLIRITIHNHWSHTVYTIQYNELQYETLYPLPSHWSHTQSMKKPEYHHSHWPTTTTTRPFCDQFLNIWWPSWAWLWSKSSDYNQLELYVRLVRLTFDIPQHLWYIPHKLYIKQGVKQWWRYIIHGIQRGCSSHWIQCTTMQTTSQTLHPSSDQTTSGQFSSLIHQIDTLDNIKVHSFWYDGW